MIVQDELVMQTQPVKEIFWGSSFPCEDKKSGRREVLVAHCDMAECSSTTGRGIVC
ncbi:unnamed protein product [Amoebophrya sp. A120]|nr:unnamed protein product [Amoebophrya sp. A120]|eukprot:GSA120T00011914001.1